VIGGSRGAGAVLGAEHVGAEHVGAEHVGAEHVGAEHVGAEHGRARGADQGAPMVGAWVTRSESGGTRSTPSGSLR
jgi:hypothetical protein